MKRSLALAVLISSAFSSPALATQGALRAHLVPTGPFEVGGFAQLTRVPASGTKIVVVARGLKAGAAYQVFYHSSDCDGASRRAGAFVANPSGGGLAQVWVADDIDAIGSVSLSRRSSPGAVVACARVRG